MHPLPTTIALLGAPGTGAHALAQALREQVPASAAHILCHIAVLDREQQPGAPTAQAPQAQADALSHSSVRAGLVLSQSASLTLLMGLDLPGPAEDRDAQEACDAALRVALTTAGVSYRVVYGQGIYRLENALKAIKNIAVSAYPSSASGLFDPESSPRITRLRAWNCEKCSDPECEHRLFTALTGQGRSSNGLATG